MCLGPKSILSCWCTQAGHWLLSLCWALPQLLPPCNAGSNRGLESLSPSFWYCPSPLTHPHQPGWRSCGCKHIFVASAKHMNSWDPFQLMRWSQVELLLELPRSGAWEDTSDANTCSWHLISALPRFSAHDLFPAVPQLLLLWVLHPGRAGTQQYRPSTLLWGKFYRG